MQSPSVHKHEDGLNDCWACGSEIMKACDDSICHGGWMRGLTSNACLKILKVIQRASNVAYLAIDMGMHSASTVCDIKAPQAQNACEM